MTSPATPCTAHLQIGIVGRIFDTFHDGLHTFHDGSPLSLLKPARLPALLTSPPHAPHSQLEGRLCSIIFNRRRTIRFRARDNNCLEHSKINSFGFVRNQNVPGCSLLYLSGVRVKWVIVARRCPPVESGPFDWLCSIRCRKQNTAANRNYAGLCSVIFIYK